jgi:MFS family permease
MSNSRSIVSYGWYVLAASFAILFVNAGARLMIGVFEKPVTAEFGWSRGQFSAVVFVNTAMLAVSMVVTGHLYDRFGPRWVILASSLLFSGGLLLTAVMDGLWQFFLFYGVIAGAGLGGVAAPIFGAIVSHWFERARGTAISLAMSGSSLGQFALVPLFTMYYLDAGWRSTMAWMGLLTLVVNVALALLVLRGDPDDLGKEPYGQVSGAVSGAPAEVDEVTGGEAVIVVHPHIPLQEPRSLGLREAMRTRSFWLFTVAMFVCGAGDFLLTTHLVAMATDYGVPTSTAVAMLAGFGLLSLGGILLAGPASDLIGDKIPIAVAFALRVAVFVLIVRYQAEWAFWVLALGFGFTFLVTAPLTTTLMGRLYGFASIGLLSGFVTTVHHFGGGVWALLGGVVYDATGAYTSAMALSAVASAAALVCTLLIREVRHVAPDGGGGAGPGPQAAVTGAGPQEAGAGGAERAT